MQIGQHADTQAAQGVRQAGNREPHLRELEMPSLEQEPMHRAAGDEADTSADEAFEERPAVQAHAHSLVI